MKYYFKLLLAVVVAICITLSACAKEGTEQSRESRTGKVEAVNAGESGAYYTAVFDGTYFWAAGTAGRLIRISMDNEVELPQSLSGNDLNDLWAGDEGMLICGDEGTILYCADGEQFVLAESTTTVDLNAVTCFNGSFFAGGESGVVLTSSDGLNWANIQLPDERDIIGLESNDSIIMAITRETDYYISTDGSNWDGQNYNQYYEGYSDQYIFNCLKSMGDTFFVAGQMKEYPDTPFVMYTETGEVWFNKPLAEINGTDPSSFFPLYINAIGYNLDQIVAACNYGRLLTITNCAECNQADEYAQADLYDLAFGNGKLLIVGEEYSHSIIDVNTVRQYTIQPAQALEDYNYRGAVIIDVRSDEEWAEGHIPGALHIPVDKISDRLLDEVPDQNTQLIFYCAVGGRAQTALEEALELGYMQVYNLGGICDWPYDIE